MILGLITEAVAAGARFEVACETIDLAPRTVQRWKDAPDGDDRRVGPKTTPRHALTAEERAMVIALATSQKYRNLSVRQVVPLVADEGLYVASESSFYRVLHDENLMAHRNAARPARHAKPKALVANGPCQVWSWDITYLRSATRGEFYFLYLVLDVWSRKIVGWEVHEKECSNLASGVVEHACARERVQRGKLTLHSDDGGPMKGATMLATLRRLGIAASFSRPRVSDDNAICEAIFRTLKYRPGYPRKPFASVEQARAWVTTFVAWYNDEHPLHSAITYVTPSARHEGRDVALLAARHALYVASKAATPWRGTGNTRDWTRAETVTLNPEGTTEAA